MAAGPQTTTESITILRSKITIKSLVPVAPLQLQDSLSYLFLPALLTCLFVLGSCSSSKKLSTPATVVTLQLPDTLPALPISEIDLPLKICSRPWLAMADSMVPMEFTSDGWPAYMQASCEFRYKYRFVRSGFTLACTDNNAVLLMNGNYQVAGSRCFCALDKPVSPWVSGSCGFGKEPMRRVNIAIRSQLSVTPGYRIQTQTRLDQLKAPDKCVVSLLSTDITQQITDSIRSSITGFCNTLDETLGGLNFTDYIHHASQTAWQKTGIGPYGYLVINPTSLRIGRLNLAKDTFSISVGLSCRPQCSSDSTNPAVLPPLPPLQSGINRDGIALYLQADYSYHFISRLLHDTLLNKSFEFKGSTVIIKDVELRGIGRHQIEVRVDFAGSRKGRVYFRGTPILDTAKQALSIPDISYSLESRDLALKMARTFFRNRIRRTLKGNSYLDLGSLIKANLPSLDSQLNKQLAPNLYTKGSTKAVRMIGLLAGDKNCQVQLMVKANLTVISTGLPGTGLPGTSPTSNGRAQALPKGFSPASNH